MTGNENGHPPEYSSFLKRVYFLEKLQEAEIDAIARLCVKERFLKDSVIFIEGSAADKFYIVMDGEVEVWKDYGDQRKSLLASHGPGHFFGEMALVDELPRSATLLARTDTLALSIERDAFHTLIRSNVSIAMSVMKSISLMLRKSNEAFVKDLTEQNARLEIAYAELKAAQNDSLRNERLSTIGKFSSLILHDIRNPLSVMKALAELIDNSVGNPVDVHSGMVRMGSEISRMERLAAEFLDYSRGEIRLSLGVCTVKSIFQQVADGMDSKFQKAGINLELEDKVQGSIVVDSERFVRVLLNLLDNARKAMPSGGRARVLAERVGDELVFTVSDNGEGMSDAVQARVFEPFFSDSGKGGTGLGMLIVKNIVEAHEGSVELFSKVGVGTRIRISLPDKI